MLPTEAEIKRNPYTMFPLHQIVFHTIPERTTFNGNTILFGACLERFPFPFRKEHYEFMENLW